MATCSDEPAKVPPWVPLARASGHSGMPHFRFSIRYTKCQCRHLRPASSNRASSSCVTSLGHPKAILPVSSSLQSSHSGVELLPAMKTHSSYHYHGGGLAPNSSSPVQHSRNPATPLKPDIRLGPLHHPSETRKRQAPISFGTYGYMLLSTFCDLCTAYLSNRL